MACPYPAHVESNITVASCLLLAVTSISYSYTRVAGRVLRGIWASSKGLDIPGRVVSREEPHYPCLVRFSSQLDVD